MSPPTPERGEGRVSTPDLRSTSCRLATSPNRSTIRRAYVSADVTAAAAQLVESMGPDDAIEWARRLHIVLTGGADDLRGGSIYRVRHRGSWWQASTRAKVRYFAQEGHARRFAVRMRRRGHDVELASAERRPWVVAP